MLGSARFHPYSSVASAIYTFLSYLVRRSLRPAPVSFPADTAGLLPSSIPSSLFRIFFSPATRRIPAAPLVPPPMEGVGARLGRSSTRFGGPATVFMGPVRKWKKRWVHVSSSPSSNPSSGNHASHLLLFKWTPVSQTNNGSKGGSTSPPEEPPKKKFRYVPVSVIEEQNEDNVEKVEDETKPSDASTTADPSPATEKTEDSGGNPEDNDITIAENQASNKDQAGQQDLNRTNLDLNLG